MALCTAIEFVGWIESAVEITQVTAFNTEYTETQRSQRNQNRSDSLCVESGAVHSPALTCL